MEETLRARITPIVGDIEKHVDDWLGATDTLRAALNKLAQVDPRYSAYLCIKLEFFDTERGELVHLIEKSLNAVPDQGLSLTNEQQPIVRYLVDDEVAVVPRNYCPKCWAEWHIFDKPYCSKCDLTLGHDCFILLEDQSCLLCGKGLISKEQLKCNECGYKVHPAYVKWV